MLLVHVDDDFDDTFRRFPIESFNHQSKQQEKQTQIYLVFLSLSLFPLSGRSIQDRFFKE